MNKNEITRIVLFDNNFLVITLGIDEDSLPCVKNIRNIEELTTEEVSQIHGGAQSGKFELNSF